MAPRKIDTTASESGSLRPWPVRASGWTSEPVWAENRGRPVDPVVAPGPTVVVAPGEGWSVVPVVLPVPTVEVVVPEAGVVVVVPAARVVVVAPGA